MGHRMPLGWVESVLILLGLTHFCPIASFQWLIHHDVSRVAAILASVLFVERRSPS